MPTPNPGRATLKPRDFPRMAAQDRSPDRPNRPLRLVKPAEDDRRTSDAEMVRAHRAGEAWASRAIWDRYSDRVHRFLQRALGRPSAEVEDLTQEVFLRLFARVHVIREPGALREF